MPEVPFADKVHRKVFVEFSAHTAPGRDARSKDFLADIGLARILEAEIVNPALIPTGIIKMSTSDQYFVVDERQSVFADKKSGCFYATASLPVPS